MDFKLFVLEYHERDIDCQNADSVQKKICLRTSPMILLRTAYQFYLTQITFYIHNFVLQKLGENTNMKELPSLQKVEDHLIKQNAEILNKYFG